MKPINFLKILGLTLKITYYGLYFIEFFLEIKEIHLKPHIFFQVLDGNCCMQCITKNQWPTIETLIIINKTSTMI
jgi:hypothetical protein